MQINNLAAVLAYQQGVAERLEQCAVDRVLLRIVLRVPLDAERKTRCVGNPNRFDRSVFRHALDDNPFARFEDALTVKRIDANGLAAEQRRKSAAGNQTDFMPVGED